MTEIRYFLVAESTQTAVCQVSNILAPRWGARLIRVLLPGRRHALSMAWLALRWFTAAPLAWLIGCQPSGLASLYGFRGPLRSGTPQILPDGA